ncbi:MAG: polysaccharide biosynthesis protein PslG [Thermoleophilaceae bacterium]|nr:polysaccharide biosynthesis protein PslG [Thermoleophilaceae bacterium]
MTQEKCPLARSPKRIVIVALLVALASAAAEPAAAATPGPFFGMNLDGDLAVAAPAAVENQIGAMPLAGAGSLRATFSWADAQPGRGDAPSFAASDPIVAAAARGGLTLAPVVTLAPAWARREPDVKASAPRHSGDYARFLTALVGRYGPSGTFWTEHPELPRAPVRDWQVWNEPHLRYQWRSPHWERDYGALLRASRRALRAADPGGRIVLAGLANKSWRYLARLYRHGRIRGAFDVAAVHPYTATAPGVLTIVQRFRRVMKRRGDDRLPVWITELGLPAAEGRIDATTPLQTTDRGMASFLSRSYALLLAARRDPAVRVERAYWYTWASSYCCDLFGFAGLKRYDPESGRLRARPAFAAYRRVALGSRR